MSSRTITITIKAQIEVTKCFYETDLPVCGWQYLALKDLRVTSDQFFSSRYTR